MTLSAWPALNAALNATSAVLVIAGYRAIRRRRIGVHRICMLGACLASGLFFVSYAVYHAQVGSVRFQGTGWARTSYVAILISHTILAVVIVPLVLRTAWLALRQRFVEHKAIARLTVPMWLYVSVTGVVVYWMLYRIQWN